MKPKTHVKQWGNSTRIWASDQVQISICVIFSVKLVVPRYLLLPIPVLQFHSPFLLHVLSTQLLYQILSSFSKFYSRRLQSLPFLGGFLYIHFALPYFSIGFLGIRFKDLILPVETILTSSYSLSFHVYFLFLVTL